MLPTLLRRAPPALLLRLTRLGRTPPPPSTAVSVSWVRTPPIRQRRCYHASRFVGNDEDDKAAAKDNHKDSKYIVINNTDMSEAELEGMFAEEEGKMRAEQEAKFVKNWKPGMRKRFLQQSIHLEEFKYELEPDKHAPRWTLRDKRCGALAIKVGMMPVFDDWGVRHACTVLFMDNNVVLSHKTSEKHGYCAVQLAGGQRKRKNVGKAVMGQYKELLDDEENPPYLVREFLVSDESMLPPLHSQIHARHFVPGQNVDVAGTSKGKGFQGAMKRHNFSGMPASHGVSKSHRALGSTGQCQDPGRVFKGKKMAGHMGHERVTTQNLRVVKVDRGRNLLYVIGSVPGNKGAFVEVRDAVKKPLWSTDKVLEGLDRPPLPTFAWDEAVDGCGTSGHEIFMPLPDADPLLPEEIAA
jgi:large subunit ribosomal protein L3